MTWGTVPEGTVPSGVRHCPLAVYSRGTSLPAILSAIASAKAEASAKAGLSSLWTESGSKPDPRKDYSWEPEPRDKKERADLRDEQAKLRVAL